MNQKLYDQILTKIKNHNINDEYKLTDDANGIWDAIESIGFNKTKDDYKTEMKVFEDYKLIEEV